MTLVLTVALAVLCLQCTLFCAVGGACEKEADLNFHSCDLKHLNDDVLTVSGLWPGGAPSVFCPKISSEVNHHLIL